MNVTLRHLRAFVEVAHQGAFTRAAQALALSQPALTVVINQFETELGFKLFDRTTRRVRLTQEGERFLPTAEHLLDDFDQALEDLRAVSERRRGKVAIAA
ncbi:MAG: LysR family transcriptional regulator, partial [Kiloniellales bacterium]|nr:LysR family transcriptional regulator [Kiloniellales bacterium]